MLRVKHELTPSEIRAIREHLGLSQVEAGELIGGGPSSFTKYEAGTVKPAASVINLLRLLEANPAAILTLGGGMPRPINAFGSGPFEVTGDHISVLRERDLPLLLRKLLSTEAQAHSLPADGIQVASNIHAPDGGEDGSITWTAGPERTSFLPSRLNQFQLKAGKISPAGRNCQAPASDRPLSDAVGAWPGEKIAEPKGRLTRRGSLDSSTVAIPGNIGWLSLGSSSTSPPAPASQEHCCGLHRCQSQASG